MITNNYELMKLDGRTVKSFRKIKNNNLNDLEKYALGKGLAELVFELYSNEFGKEYARTQADFINEHIRYNDDYIDILDGVYDTFEVPFNGKSYAFYSLWVTNNGIILMDVNPFKDNEMSNYNQINHDKTITFRVN